MDPREQIRDYRTQLRDKQNEVNDANKRIFELEGKLEDAEYELRQLKVTDPNSGHQVQLQQALAKVARLEREVAQKATGSMTGKGVIKQEQDEMLQAADDSYLLQQHNVSLQRLVDEYSSSFTDFENVTGIDFANAPTEVLKLKQQSASAQGILKQLENEQGIAAAREKIIKNYESKMTKMDKKIEEWKAIAVDIQKKLDRANSQRIDAETRLKREQISKDVDAGRIPLTPSQIVTLRVPNVTPALGSQTSEKRKRSSRANETIIADLDYEEDDDEPLSRTRRKRQARVAGQRR